MSQTADAALGRVVSVDARARRCLFVGVKRTSLKNAPRTAFDPDRTSPRNSEKFVRNCWIIFHVMKLVSNAAAGDVPGSVEFLKRSALPTLSR